MIFNRGAGYSITEVLIVIAISGMMFLSATVVFRGRQQQVQFDQAVRDFESQLRDIMNDVSTGYYPSDVTVACEVGTIDNNPPLITQDATNDNSLGSNEECVFVGKALQFKSSDLSEPNSSYRVFSLAGKRFISDNNPELAETVARVQPTAVEFTDTVNQIRYGVEITKIVEVVSPTLDKEHGIVVFLSNLDGGNIASAVSQSQNVRVAGIYSNTSSYGLDKSNAVTLINELNEDPSTDNGYIDLRSRNGVTFCLDDGAGRVASISVGGVNSQSTLLKIGNVAGECI